LNSGEFGLLLEMLKKASVEVGEQLLALASYFISVFFNLSLIILDNTISLQANYMKFLLNFKWRKMLVMPILKALLAVILALIIWTRWLIAQVLRGIFTALQTKVFALPNPLLIFQFYI
jgi:hypothetical protein